MALLRHEPGIMLRTTRGLVQLEQNPAPLHHRQRPSRQDPDPEYQSHRFCALLQGAQVLFRWQSSTCTVILLCLYIYAYCDSTQLKLLKFKRESLREAILLANSEDLMTISANAMLFSGHVNLISGQYQESFNMLTNGFDLADKTNDVALKSYATLLLKGWSLLLI